MALQMQTNLKLTCPRPIFFFISLSLFIQRSNSVKAFPIYSGTQSRKRNSSFCLIYIQMPLKWPSNPSPHCHCPGPRSSPLRPLWQSSYYLPVSRISPLFKCLRLSVWFFSNYWPYQSPTLRNIWWLPPELVFQLLNMAINTLHNLPWLVWLSGLSAGLRIKGLLGRFPVRAHGWVAGQVPSRGRVRGNRTLMFLSLFFSLPSPL